MTQAGNPAPWMVLLIGGPSGVGKSTVARELAHRSGASWLQIDDIRLAMQFHPQIMSHIPDASALRFFLDTPDVWHQPVERLVDAFVAVADLLAPSLQIIIENHIAIREPIVIEGDGVLPSLLDSPVLQQLAVQGLLRSTWLIPAGPEMLLENSRKRARGTTGEDAETGRRWAAAGWAYGQWLKSEAMQRDLPVRSPEPYATLTQRMRDLLTGSNESEWGESSVNKRYHHIGLPAPDQETPIPGETYMAGGDIWISSPDDHPQRIEWLRYGPNNKKPLDKREAPHICYEVDDLDAFLESIGSDAKPNEMGNPPFGRGVFLDDGSGIETEYLEVYPGRHWFDDEAKGLI